MTFDRRPQIAPSILSADFATSRGMPRDRSARRGLGACGCDGWPFRAEHHLRPATCAAIRKHIKGVMDVHLMINPVDPYLEAFAKAGADVISIHLEVGPHIHRSLQTIRNLGKKAGLAINPGTGIDAVPYLLDQLDLICVMTVNPASATEADPVATGQDSGAARDDRRPADPYRGRWRYLTRDDRRCSCGRR